jgi:hypothetical protein
MRTGSAPEDGSRMTATSMIEAAGKFAAALDELRRKHVGAFELWLKGALGNSPDAVEKGIAERIAGVRKQFADEFINGRAPVLLAALNPQSRLDIVQQLRTFEAHADRVRYFDTVTRDGGRGQPGMLRALVGAALGAAAGLLLFLLQAGGPNEATIPTAQAPSTQALSTQAPSAQQPAPPAALPNEAPLAAPRGDGPAPRPKEGAAPLGPHGSPELSAFMVLSGACGAALGVFIVLCPPLRRLTRMGFGPGVLGLAQRFGLGFLLLREGVAAAAVRVAVTALAGLAGLFFTGPKPLWTVLLGLAAVLLIVLFRSAFPQGDARDQHAAARRAAVTALDRELTVDSELWTALAAGLATRPASAASQQPELDHVRSIILARRDSAEPADSILGIVEQELGLPIGPRQDGATQTEFIWGPQHADQYQPYGVVKAGDRVEVKVPPRMTNDAGGAPTVFQKGTVIRKR